MNIKRYINEIFVLLALIFMFVAYFYKHHQVSQQTIEVEQTKHTLSKLQEVVALKKIWAHKKITKKVTELKNIVSASKVNWSQKQNKVTATYTKLSSTELNKLTTKILNTPVVIRLLDIKKIGETYTVEFKCKW